MTPRQALERAAQVALEEGCCPKCSVREREDYWKEGLVYSWCQNCGYETLTENWPKDATPYQIASRIRALAADLPDDTEAHSDDRDAVLKGLREMANDDFWPGYYNQIVCDAITLIERQSAPPDTVALHDALERIASVSAGGPHVDAREAVLQALAALHRARNIARAALARLEGEVK